MKYLKFSRKNGVSLLVAITVTAAVNFLVFYQLKMNAKNSEFDPTVHVVALLEDRAVPSELAIPVGNSVQFNSQDGRIHKIGVGKGGDFGLEHEHLVEFPDATEFGPDDAYRVNFKKTGVFYLHDHLHPELFTTVIVYQPE